MKQLKNERGLTLVELLAVIVILAIIAAIAAVAIGNVINNSKDKAILSDAVTIIDGVKIAEMDGALGSSSADVITIKNGTNDKPNINDLKPYVELSDAKWEGLTEIKIEGMSSGNTNYTISYQPLGEIKNSKYTPGTATKTQPTATLTELLEALEGNPKKAAK